MVVKVSNTSQMDDYGWDRTYSIHWTETLLVFAIKCLTMTCNQYERNSGIFYGYKIPILLKSLAANMYV